MPDLLCQSSKDDSGRLRVLIANITSGHSPELTEAIFNTTKLNTFLQLCDIFFTLFQAPWAEKAIKKFIPSWMNSILKHQNNMKFTNTKHKTNTRLIIRLLWWTLLAMESLTYHPGKSALPFSCFHSSVLFEIKNIQGLGSGTQLSQLSVPYPSSHFSSTPFCINRTYNENSLCRRI